MIGLGMLVGINGLNTFGKKIATPSWSTPACCGIAVGLSSSALHHIWSTLLGDFIIGCSVAGIIIPAQTLMQQETPPELMGRVGSPSCPASSPPRSSACCSPEHSPVHQRPQRLRPLRRHAPPANPGRQALHGAQTNQSALALEGCKFTKPVHYPRNQTCGFLYPSTNPLRRITLHWRTINKEGQPIHQAEKTSHKSVQ
jgi:hypothetical protein